MLFCPNDLHINQFKPIRKSSAPKKPTWPKLKIYILCFMPMGPKLCVGNGMCLLHCCCWIHSCLELKVPFWTVIKNKNVMRNSHFVSTNVLFHLSFIASLSCEILGYKTVQCVSMYASYPSRLSMVVGLSKVLEFQPRATPWRLYFGNVIQI